MPFRCRALTAVVPALLAACASVQMASPDRDYAAKEFSRPSKGKAFLYVFRDGSMASAKMTLELDGAFLGETSAKTYQWVSLKPGKHTLVGKAENESRVQFTAESGQSVFIWQDVKMGFMSASNRLEVVDEQRGRAGVEQCELAEARVRTE